MGRELKRVPLNFDWPIDEIWKGYINPYWKHHRTCEMCDGSGYSQKAKYIADQWYGDVQFDPNETGSEPFTFDMPEVRQIAKRNINIGIDIDPYYENRIRLEALRLCRHFNRQWSHHLSQEDVNVLAEELRLMDFTHIFDRENGWRRREDGYIPTAREVNIWSLSGFGHDSINRYICIEAKCNRLGIEVNCPYCNGGGNLWPSEEIKQAYEDWKDYDPPIGEGFQLWNTTTEGHPMSPVFSTLDELCEWCAANTTTFASYTASKEEWRQMLDDGLVYHEEGNVIFI